MARLDRYAMDLERVEAGYFRDFLIFSMLHLSNHADCTIPPADIEFLKPVGRSRNGRISHFREVLFDNLPQQTVGGIGKDFQ